MANTDYSVAEIAMRVGYRDYPLRLQPGIQKAFRQNAGQLSPG